MEGAPFYVYAKEKKELVMISQRWLLQVPKQSKKQVLAQTLARKKKRVWAY